MLEAPILPGPRHGWSARFLELVSWLPVAGSRVARIQRVRRKRWRAELAGMGGPTTGILESDVGRACDRALRIWHQLPPREVVHAPMDGEPCDPSIRCSVIISTVDRAQDLKRTLSDLRNHWCGEKDELVIVLGPTLDDSREVIASAPIPCRVVDCAERNLAVSRNLGVLAARGAYVAFLDDDASPCESWLEALLRPLQDEPMCAVAAGFAMDGAGEKFLTRYVVSDHLGDSTWWDREEDAKTHMTGDGGRFLSATGCNMAFRRDQVLKVGGFDPFYAYFLEETDLVLRLKRNGLDCVACPDALVHHRQGPNVVRSAEVSLIPRMRLLKSQLHYIRKFAGARGLSDDICRSVWRRILGDMERIAWDHPEQAGELQRAYLRMVCEEMESHGIPDE